MNEEGPLHIGDLYEKHLFSWVTILIESDPS